MRENSKWDIHHIQEGEEIRQQHVPSPLNESCLMWRVHRCVLTARQGFAGKIPANGDMQVGQNDTLVLIPITS